MSHHEIRDRGATLRLGGTTSDSILGGGGHKTLFLTNSLSILKILGGSCHYSVVPGNEFQNRV